MHLSFFQAPPFDSLNCDRIYGYRIYQRKHVPQSKYVFYMETESDRATVEVNDTFTNITFGVTVVNSAGFESERATVNFTGSKCTVY